jgi:cystinosin
VVKYSPQAWLNYRRKSTSGLSILQFTLDVIGALLSLLQLLIDATYDGDWQAVLSNTAKFALGNVSLFFDLLFYFQHYYLYRGNLEKHPISPAQYPDESDPLLGDQRILRDSSHSTERHVES